MQTFLPYADFVETAKVLDYRRLGKQRVEAYQILTNSSSWKNHPTVKMWDGYSSALMRYFNIISEEWEHRGYKHNLGYFSFQPGSVVEMPSWLGDERLHSSHRAALLFKNPEWYQQFKWEEDPKLEYWWPVK